VLDILQTTLHRSDGQCASGGLKVLMLPRCNGWGCSVHVFAHVCSLPLRTFLWAKGWSWKTMLSTIPLLCCKLQNTAHGSSYGRWKAAVVGVAKVHVFSYVCQPAFCRWSVACRVHPVSDGIQGSAVVYSLPATSRPSTFALVINIPSVQSSRLLQAEPLALLTE
jgi:hypothetical protein